MKYTAIEGVDKRTTNRYEAVIVASRRARAINTHRLKLLEMMMENSEVEIDGTKVTTLALRDVIEGKVKFKIPGSDTQSESP